MIHRTKRFCPIFLKSRPFNEVSGGHHSFCCCKLCSPLLKKEVCLTPWTHCGDSFLELWRWSCVSRALFWDREVFRFCNTWSLAASLILVCFACQKCLWCKNVCVLQKALCNQVHILDVFLFKVPFIISPPLRYSMFGISVHKNACSSWIYLYDLWQLQQQNTATLKCFSIIHLLSYITINQSEGANQYFYFDSLAIFYCT